jgi:hypothetical protein
VTDDYGVSLKNLIRKFIAIEPQDPMLPTHIRDHRDEGYNLYQSPDKKCRCFLYNVDDDDDGRPRPYKCDLVVLTF